MIIDDKKIAIVYDWIDKWGGVERVLLTLHQIFPQAHFYSSYFDPKRASWAKKILVKTSFIQLLPRAIKTNRLFSLPLYPIAFETLDFRGYDTVISVSSSFAKGIITPPQVRHICYLLTPTRFLWVNPADNYQLSGFKKIIAKPLIDYLTKWDKVAIWRPDKIISISHVVQQRCLDFYQRDSIVICPPFDREYWKNIEGKISVNKKNEFNSVIKNKYYLIVARLEPYKKIDLAVKVFNKLKKTLVVVGEGSEERKLKKMANKNIIFLKKLTDEQLGILYKNAIALIMSQEEDFGYTALEAIFFQLPVIAFNKGGVKEIVEDGKTGIFFANQSENFLTNAIARFERVRYNLKINLEKVKRDKKYWSRFDIKRFIDQFKNEIIV
jgi:glycosyltransferase involved in cell wall biosynthesis